MLQWKIWGKEKHVELENAEEDDFDERMCATVMP